MIVDLAELDPATDLHAEVVVVGAGFAGIDLACRLGRAGTSVLLLESGREGFDPRIQALTRERSVGKALRTPSPDSPFTPYLAAHYRGESRVRALGGTSTIWTGKWRPFDELDLAERPWIAHSGWPIAHDELDRAYTEVIDAYGLADVRTFAARPEVRAARERLAAHGLTCSFHYWQARPSRPGSDRRDELAASPTIRVVLGATATDLGLADDDLARVEHVTVRSLEGHERQVRGGTFVLAMGGLETPRLLLHADRQRPGGIGNARGLVGRFHQDHPKTKRARLVPGPGMATIAPWTATDPKPRFHVSVELADDVQRDERLLDHAMYLSPVRDHQVGYPDAEVAAIKQAWRDRRPVALLRAAAGLLRSPRAVRKVAQRVRHRDLGGRVAFYRASMYVEQAPDPDSRLRLTDERDELGVRRLEVDWRLNDLDRRSFEATLASLERRLADARIGRLEVEPDARTLDAWVDAAHHMGATRMAADPEHGVVDPDLKVFGTDNLYVASSSVFPTGHSAAPTMTILALSARLARHLLTSPRQERACPT